MQTAALSAVEIKTLELCQAIVEQPGFPEMFANLAAFMADESAKYQFQSINDLAQLLQEKQANGLQITDTEIAEFESLRGDFMSKSVASNFLEAQEKVQQIQSSIYKQLAKTFELGRVPTADDFANECCSSSGCGCN